MIRRFVWPKGAREPLAQLLTSVIVDSRSPAHDYLRIWDRGVLAGELTLPRGDGERWALAVGLIEDMGEQGAE